MIFLKCKIRFIYVGFNCKRKKWGKKCLEIMSIKGGSEGGVRRLMEKSILNFHLDYWNPSLIWYCSSSSCGLIMVVVNDISLLAYEMNLMGSNQPVIFQFYVRLIL